MIQLPEKSLAMFRRVCLIRYFETMAGLAGRAQKEGLIKGMVYLSIGQESISAAIATVISDYYIFAQHRAHSVYLAFGGDIIKLIDELLGLPSGCCGGIGGSPCIQDLNIKMIGHHGLIGENVPLAVGAALGSGHNTVCFFGDGAAEEDYVITSMGFAITHKLPVLFVCEDNNLSILTQKIVRRNWKIADVTKGMGIPSIDIIDDPWLIMRNTERLVGDLPAFMNCHTCRHLWHTGVGVDNPPEWDRFALIKKRLNKMGLGEQANKIEIETKDYVERLWESRISLIQSGK